MAQSTQFRFAPFRLDPSRASLWRDAEEVALPPKVFDLLCYLVRHAGEVVTKDQLLDEVWQRRFVSESSLKSCMNELRKALADDVKAPRYIATVARRGYRFIAPVSQIEPTHEAPILGEHVPLPEGLSRCWVKRASLLARLQPLWRSSLQGARQLVFLTGEARIGKTTLIEMFLAEIAEQAPSVLRARCVEHFGQGEALLPLLEAIEHQCRMESGAALIGRLRRHAPVWLAQLPSVLTSEERAALQREILGASRERMLREGCLLLEELCNAAPLVLVVEVCTGAITPRSAFSPCWPNGTCRHGCWCWRAIGRAMRPFIPIRSPRSTRNCTGAGWASSSPSSRFLPPMPRSFWCAAFRAHLS
jgi:DNA-binding winged helix-turn-helix (wHTH) protein